MATAIKLELQVYSQTCVNQQVTSFQPPTIAITIEGNNKYTMPKRQQVKLMYLGLVVGVVWAELIARTPWYDVTTLKPINNFKQCTTTLTLPRV